MWPILLLLVAALGTAQDCDYSKNNWYQGEGICINPKETATATFSFKPLFPGDVKFVYAADDIQGAETVDLEGWLDETKIGDWESSLVGYWLEYDDVSLNNTDIEMVTEMRVWFTNVSASVGGGVNGCENLLGKACTDQISTTLRNLTSKMGSFEYPLLDLPTYADDMDECPDGLFEDWAGLEPRIDTLNEGTTFNTMALAKETPSNPDMIQWISSDEVLPSGNSSFTYSRPFYEQRPFATQTSKAAVAILLRHPLGESDTLDLVRNATGKDTNIALVCAQLSGGGDGNDDAGGSGGGGDDDAAMATGVPVALLTVIVAALMLIQV